MVDKRDILIREIANHLILNTTVQKDISLFYGKMGIVLFFAHLSVYLKEPVYIDFAGELLDEIYEEISIDMPINLGTGLCGIGWGINYLLQNKFVEGDADEILVEIDKKIMERDPLRIYDRTLKSGLSGIAYYVYRRLSCLDNRKKFLYFDRDYIRNINLVAKDVEKLDDKYLLFYLIKSAKLKNNFYANDLGLYHGLAGYGLRALLR